MPAVRNRFWDGKIRLFNAQTKKIYAGLLPHVQQFCNERDYNLEIDPAYADEEFSIAEAKQFASKLDLPFEVRDYQLDAFAHAVKKKRALMLSPTASGKSLIIYLLAAYLSKKTLIVVPTISLVQQMAGDFKSYGYVGNPHLITAGVEKDTSHLLTISTCLLYTSPSPRDATLSRMPSSA